MPGGKPEAKTLPPAAAMGGIELAELREETKAAGRNGRMKRAAAFGGLRRFQRQRTKVEIFYKFTCETFTKWKSQGGNLPPGALMAPPLSTSDLQKGKEWERIPIFLFDP
ncbi:hypothetical protein CRG98_047326 [Punica granatum]|uniref:Uncharacterized protein n=1 Tax=Punica granatum TaxID=22663 RepID=A0A2I0HL16_PUNGR|nr:hypothetical protein CRG98_047326 [Punica granatum]